MVSGGDIEKEAHTETKDGLMINSSNDSGLDLNGMRVSEAIDASY